MSLYSNYLKERTNDEILETDTGFATYRYLNEKQVYIVDIYVLPEHRELGDAASMADQICMIAKNRGCTELIGTVDYSTKEALRSAAVLKGYGMTPFNGVVAYRKDI